MVSWQNIDTVLLDMDGTLLDLHYDNYFWLTHLPRRYAAHHKVALEQAQQTIQQKVQQYAGTLQWYCLDHWSNLVDMDIPALKREITHKIKPRPYTEQFLQRLQQLKKNVVLITNAHPAGLKIKLDVTRIDQWLNTVISSHEFRTPKEDGAFWQHLQHREAFDKRRSLFIDDNIEVLRSARDYGMEHLICITKPDSQKAEKPSDEFVDICHFDTIMPDV